MEYAQYLKISIQPFYFAQVHKVHNAFITALFTDRSVIKFVLL